MQFILSHEGKKNKHSSSRSSFFRSATYEDEAKSFEACAIPFEDLTIPEVPFAAGGAGQVYMGTLRLPDQSVVPVVAKRTFNMMWDPSATDDFDNELKMLARLRHPNIVQTFGVSSDPLNDAIYMCLEYCSRGTLNDFFAIGKTSYTPAAFGKAATELLAGVGYMHRSGVVHRDLKPQNIFVGADGMIRIGDLGSTSSKKIFGEGGVGTVHYLPPEAMRLLTGASSTADPATWDVFALGTILVEMWARKHPWDHMARDEVKVMLLDGKRPDFPVARPVSATCNIQAAAIDQEFPLTHEVRLIIFLFMMISVTSDN